MQKITKSIRIDPELWKEVKIQSTKEDKDISSFIEQALKKELHKK